MKLKEFKELINSLPDDYNIGYTTVSSVTENFNRGTSEFKVFYPEININIDVMRKNISLVEIRKY